MRQPDILFAEDFDAAPAPPVDAAPDIIEPLFTAADLADAREAGRLAGLRQAEQGLAASRNQLLAELATAIVTTRDEAAAAAGAMAEDVARAILSAAVTVLPFVCSQNGEREIRAIAAFLLPRLRDEPQVTVTVNPAQFDAMQADIAAMEPGAVSLAASDAVPPGDLRVAWHKGTAYRRTDPALAAVRQAFAALGLLDVKENANG